MYLRLKNEKFFLLNFAKKNKNYYLCATKIEKKTDFEAEKNN